MNHHKEQCFRGSANDNEVNRERERGRGNGSAKGSSIYATICFSNASTSQFEIRVNLTAPWHEIFFLKLCPCCPDQFYVHKSMDQLS